MLIHMIMRTNSVVDHEIVFASSNPELSDAEYERLWKENIDEAVLEEMGADLEAAIELIHAEQEGDEEYYTRLTASVPDEISTARDSVLRISKLAAWEHTAAGNVKFRLLSAAYLLLSAASGIENDPQAWTYVEEKTFAAKVDLLAVDSWINGQRNRV